jgi:hypothetical protein
MGTVPIPSNRPGTVPIPSNRPGTVPKSERGKPEVYTVGLSDAVKYIARPEERPLIIAIGTGWIKGYGQPRSIQRDALNPLLSNIRNCRRFEKARFIVEDDAVLLAAIRAGMGEPGFGNARVIALAAEATLSGDLASIDDGKNVLVGVDATFLTDVSCVRLVEMLKIAAMLALDPDSAPVSPNIPVEKRGRFWVFIPRAEPRDFEELRKAYEVQKFA